MKIFTSILLAKSTMVLAWATFNIIEGKVIIGIIMALCGIFAFYLNIDTLFRLYDKDN